MNGYVDIHTHILPGVDDGAEDMSQALAMVRMAYKNGTRTLFLTPHYRGRYKKNDPQRLSETFDFFCEMVKQELPGMKLYLGNEIYYEQEAPDRLSAKRILSMNGSRYCLLEFQPGSLRSQIVIGVSEMVRNGFVPIIAHAERYAIFRKDKTLVDEVLEIGALIQLNADSIMGKHGLGVLMFCKKLLKEQKAHFVASDAHNEKDRPPLLRDCWWKVYKLCGKEYAVKLFHDNAQWIIENE